MMTEQFEHDLRLFLECTIGDINLEYPNTIGPSYNNSSLLILLKMCFTPIVHI